MIRILHLAKDGEFDSDLTVDDIAGILARPQTLVWIDIQAESAAAVENLLEGELGFHHLAVEDALRDETTPKIDDWGKYIYIALRGVNFERQLDEFDMDKTGKLDIFKSHHLLVTHHKQPIMAIDREWERCQRDRRHVEKGAGRLLHLVMDGMATDYMTLMETLDDTIDEIEDEVFSCPRQSTLERIFSAKRAVLHIRRTLSPQREVLNKLVRDHYETIDPKNKIYYRDVYDHMVRLYELNESLRDIISSAMDMYLSVTSNRTNDIMKVLTVTATLFMPLTFISGFWGMNFYEPFHDPKWCNPTVMWWTLGIMLALPVGMLAYMRKKHWI